MQFRFIDFRGERRPIWHTDLLWNFVTAPDRKLPVTMTEEEASDVLRQIFTAPSQLAFAA